MCPCLLIAIRQYGLHCKFPSDVQLNNFSHFFHSNPQKHSVLVGSILSNIIFIACILPFFACSMACLQIASTSFSKSCSASTVALFLVPLGLPRGLPDFPFLNFPCFSSVLSGIFFTNFYYLLDSTSEAFQRSNGKFSILVCMIGSFVNSLARISPFSLRVFRNSFS